MKKTTWICLMLAAALLCLTACASVFSEETETGYQLYFRAQEDEDSGAALVSVSYEGTEDPTPRQLMNALLAGPDSAEAASPFPMGVALRSWKIEDGILYVDMSESYGGLTDIDLTVADYAITLTMCQLDTVDGVCITVAGQPLNYRSHQVLTPEEVPLETAE